MDQQHVHIIGICGTAMASLAGLLKQRGFKVTGSDAAAYPPMSDFLAAMAIPVAQPYAETNLKPRPDWVVVGNAISRGNVELEHVLDQRIQFRSMPDTLYDHFLRTREPIVVAGTHGKTTTTSMLAWIFQKAGKDPSFLVGGIAENFGSSFALRQGKHFIIEGDEYDTAFFDKGPKFLHYFPQAIILTSVEFDHADIYKDLDAVKIAFKRLVNLVPSRGKIVAWDASENVDECIAKAFTPVERYGMKEGSFWRISNLKFAPESTTWTVVREGQPWADFEFALAGEYNVLNATAAAAMASHYGIEPQVIAEALRSFKSVKRRLEVKAEVDGITIIDDFAHHPTAIAATLTALRTRYPDSRLWAI
ncbi:MAG TPA: UDP-N-acetylmuramate:L-alanyl-gamma-D-glutamyl-meso-diaminopimelate ligase, partial [Candidatus Angelobacter sp.]|nr:UDP-N-acetylmuramate:L-alanyl-gamma-D-glutamyl-meso-diaminopimelate ligase [Candidatus Angelobacter sp.]